MIQTILCTRLGIEIPIIQAPMGGAAGPALAAAVSNAGGLGLLPLWRADAATMREAIRATRRLTDRPFGVNLNLNWPQDEWLALCLDENVPVISLFWGDPAGLIGTAHAGGAVVLQTVGSATEARRAADLGADVIVAQGWEAGGHVWGGVATLPLVPAVVDAVASVPVVAAGGIADGRGLAAVLALGAAGAWIGTRFLASPEASIHPHYRERVLGARETETFFGEVFDIGWPGAPHRVLVNETVRAWEKAGRPEPGKRPGEGEPVVISASDGEVVRYRSYTPRPDIEGDVDALPLWAGQSAGLVGAVKPAGEIVREIAAAAEAILHRLPAGSTRPDQDR